MQNKKRKNSYGAGEIDNDELDDLLFHSEKIDEALQKAVSQLLPSTLHAAAGAPSSPLLTIEILTTVDDVCYGPMQRYMYFFVKSSVVENRFFGSAPQVGVKLFDPSSVASPLEKWMIGKVKHYLNLPTVQHEPSWLLVTKGQLMIG